MKIFLTGATGFIGSKLAIHLAENGHEIHALVRSISRAKEMIDHPGVKFFQGNLNDKSQYLDAMQGCEQAYLLAAYAQVWNKDPDVFYEINVRNNMGLIREAFNTGISKVVITSTAGVFGPSQNNENVSESSEKWTDLTTDYEKSKLQAEEQIKAYVQETGNNVVIVNPTRVYGPGKLSPSNSVTRMMKEFYEGKWHVYPGNGKAMGNYAFVDDVINGHLLAMDKGVSGENYILGGDNCSYKTIFSSVHRVSGKKTWIIGVPIWAMMLIARIQMGIAKLTGKGPLLTPGFVKKYNFSWNNTSEKAKRELGYSFRSLDEGIKEVINWVKK